MSKPTHSNLSLLAGLGLAGAVIAGCAATGVAAAAALALRRHLAASSRDLSGKVVVITGGSRGLGLAIAQRFARAGAHLVLASRNLQELESAHVQLIEQGPVTSPQEVLLVPADLTSPGQAASIVDQALAHFGRIDVLINNAGVIEIGPVEDQPTEAYRRAMETHFFAALHTTQAALPSMLARAANGQSSAIVNIASIGGKVAVPHLLPYVASKFALVGFSEGLHAELRHKGIRVTTVCPGLMRTGGESHAHFTGQVAKEQAWFKLSARTPVLSASVTHAANRIFNAVAAGRAEITITPQAWLMARFHGLAPETTQVLAALANHFVLPASAHGAGATDFKETTLVAHQLHQ